VTDQVKHADGLPGVSGDYHGRPTRRLENPVLGRRSGSRRAAHSRIWHARWANVLAETPDATWDSGHGCTSCWRASSLGCARDGGLQRARLHGLTLRSISDADGPGRSARRAIEVPTGLRKTFEVRLDAESR